MCDLRSDAECATRDHPSRVSSSHCSDQVSGKLFPSIHPRISHKISMALGPNRCTQPGVWRVVPRRRCNCNSSETAAAHDGPRTRTMDIAKQQMLLVWLAMPASPGSNGEVSDNNPAWGVPAHECESRRSALVGSARYTTRAQRARRRPQSSGILQEC